MMKRFLLFVGSDYYPEGGWNDFIGQFDEKDQSIQAAANLVCDWWQVVDCYSQQIVAKGHKR